MPEILYQDIPPGANEKARAEGEGQSFWDGKLTRLQTDAPYATLEPSYWRLDGTRRLLEDQSAGEGYCSCRYSGEDGAFSQPVILEAVLDQTYTATGLTLVFDRSGEEWCSEFAVQWYRDTQLLAEETVCPTGPVWVVSRIVTAFDRVKLEFLKTSRPGRFLRLDSLILGVERTFGADQLRDLELHAQVDVSGLTLVGGTARFDLDLEEDRQMLFQRRQLLGIFHRGMKKGTYYLDEAQKTGPGQYQVECMDGIGLLADSQTMGGLYEETPFGQIVEEILDGELTFRMEETLSELPLSGWIAAGTKRDALLQAAFGAGAMVTVDPDGGLAFRTLPAASDKTILKNAIFQGGTVTTKAPYTRVELTASEYLPGERQTVYSGEAPRGEQTVLTQEPCYQYEIAGGKILDSGANYVTFQMESQGQVSITGRQLICRQTCYSTAMTQVAESSANNQLSAQGTMVSPARAKAVLERLRSYGENNQTVQQTVIAGDLAPGEYVTTEKAFDGQLVGYILSMTTHLTGAAVADLEILGQDVELEPTAYYCGCVFAGEG